METYESVTKHDDLQIEIEHLRKELRRMQIISMALLDEELTHSADKTQFLRYTLATMSQMHQRKHTTLIRLLFAQSC